MGRTGSGVEVRANSIRLKFTFNGERIAETLSVGGVPLAPTAANIKLAHRTAAQVQQHITRGTLDAVYAELFPDSKRLAFIGGEHAARADTLGKLLDLWLESTGNLSAATRAQYASAVRCWKAMLGPHLPLDQLTHKLLKAKIGGYPWPSAKTHNNYLIALRGALALEYHGRRALDNPAQGIENMVAPKKLPDPLTVNERDRILADMRERYDARVYAYFLWQFATGMRPEETIALRWSDVDTGRQIVRVQRVRTFRGSEREDTKTKIDRDVDLMPQALEALTLMKPYTFMKRAEREGTDDTSAEIFERPGWVPGATGGKPSESGPWHDERSQRDTYWRPTLKRLGIRWRRAYATRHTYASVALMHGVPPAYVAAQLGHSVKTLLDKYARWIPGNDGNSARDQLRRAMGGAPAADGAGRISTGGGS